MTALSRGLVFSLALVVLHGVVGCTDAPPAPPAATENTPKSSEDAYKQQQQMLKSMPGAPKTKK